ncbi:hypothetical protein C8R45DRAFT_1078664 [Mycena sanguinolenta]|nr:hypothetical protein C8R45DRAFT_1078664 [Mycena sanguinolenta]
MYRHPFLSASGKELPDRSTSLASMQESLLNSASTLLRVSREAPKRSMINSSKSLRRFCLILHLMLVFIHLALIAIWAKNIENRVVFSLENQNIVSLFITVISQTFWTIYGAVLVYVTQKLSIRRSLTTDQSLTATHDSTAAWSGIGSAGLHIWYQKAARASIAGVLSVFLYLGLILILHITTPALFSLETFTLTTPFVIQTEGLPAANLSVVATGFGPTTLNQIPDDMAKNYVTEPLFYLPYVDRNAHVGLNGGTLYDVPETNPGSGNTTVGATGFNITCGLLENVTVGSGGSDFGWELSSGNVSLGKVTGTYIDVISTLDTSTSSLGNNNSLSFYSTLPIIDSSLKSAGWVNLTTSSLNDGDMAPIQVFQCSLSLITQTAIVDAQSQKAVGLHPGINKTTSTWVNAPGTPVNSGNPLINLWGLWYSYMPTSEYSRGGDVAGGSFLSIADLYLSQKFNLNSVNQSAVPASVTLHDLENALSELVASMFWILGHIPPTKLDIPASIGVSKVFSNYTVDEEANLIFLLPGEKATVTEQSTEIRLDVNIIAVSAGLTASIMLTLLSLKYLILRVGDEKDAQDPPINGTSLLHAIWLYRNHPELEMLLEQVEHPTDENLRDAGMVRTQLVGPCLRKVEPLDSFQGQDD